MFLAGSAVLLALLAGCVHFEYEGKEEPALNAEARVYRNLDLPLKDGRMLGKAVAWGGYQDVSLDRLEEKLKEEAAARGANMVCVTADQVIPGSMVVRVDPMIQTMETVNPGNMYSLNQIQKDFDGGYGQAELFGKNAKSKEKSVAQVRDYKRIIRAEFYYSKNPPVVKNRKPSKKAPAVKKTAVKKQNSEPADGKNSATVVADQLAAAGSKKTAPASAKPAPAPAKPAPAEEKPLSVTPPPPVK